MKVAVIGAGISGLGSAWLLSQKHEVHLFESENRLGGHAHTVTVDDNQNAVPVDTGFLVYNELTYPHLTQFFKTLNVETYGSDMSLSVQTPQSQLEWAGENLNTVFGQRRNLLRPRFYRMLLDILRFAKEAEENLQLARRHAWTTGEMLAARRYSPEFIHDYLLPIGAAIWSTPEGRMNDFPAATLMTFFINHHLLQVNGRPQWRTVKNGSIQYVQKAADRIARIHLGAPVLEVERRNGKVLLKTGTETAEFDQVVMATHAPITARILKPASEHERQVLGAFSYEPNRTILHRDESVMPKTKRCWSSWNVYGASRGEYARKVSLSYYLNRLQPLPTQRNYFVTLNPTSPVEGALREFEYHHPQFDQNAIRAQRELPSIQGQGGVYFAGAWSRYGFHEDGLLSAVNATKLMGVETPWKVTG